MQAHEGFPGLKGWQPVGGIDEVIAGLEDGKLLNDQWLQYTRDRSTYIPPAQYKKLQEKARDNNTDIATVVEQEKKAMLALGRKKTLCLVSLGDAEGQLKFSSIPPSGDRGSADFPGQVRTWTLGPNATGNLIFYSKINRSKTPAVASVAEGEEASQAE